MGNDPRLIDSESMAAVISNSGWGDALEVAGISFATVIVILTALFVIVSVASVLLRKLWMSQDTEGKEE